MRTLSFVALALSTALVVPAHAQYAAGPAYPAVQAVSPADQLSAVMRRLAAAPTDLQALISAGELSVKLDDMSAAAAFFARADKIDGRNGRVKAGMASILVRAERPGEALRFYQLAESYGLDPRRYAADRGLAYDLVGEQERAQRDYRLALLTGRDDETVRRYALSLGISGKQQPALDQLEPLLQRQDRAAWRVRAFVLAMSGDVPGATRIATTMMPAGMAAGLQPFFQRLPNLPAADRAFAVHFGEVRPTPARLADARMKPLLPALGPDPFPPVQVAAVRNAVPPAVSPVQARDGRRPTRDRRQVAAATRAPVRSGTRTGAARPLATRVVNAAALAPRQTPPAVTPPVQVAARTASPVPRPVASVFNSAPAATPPAVIAGTPATPLPQRPASVGSSSPAVLASTAAVSPSTGAPGVGASQTSVAAVTAPPGRQAATPGLTPFTTASPVAQPPAVPVPSTAPVQLAAVTPSVAPTPVSQAPAQPGPGITQPSAPVSLATNAVAPPAATVAPPTTPGATAVQPAVANTVATAPTPGFSNAPIETAAAEPASLAAASAAVPTPAVRSEDSILARIVASITIPGEELGITAPAKPTPAPARVAADPATERTLAAGKVKAAQEKADRTAAARTIAAATKSADSKPAARGRSGKVETASVETDDPKPKTAAARRRAAAEEKRAAAKEKADAPRIWVQVAGGAQEADLPRAWAAAQKKAAALKGRDAYTTPLRATNRVVTGPFKTEAEAQAFVNQLARQGVSAFQFTSASGQKMTKLSSR